MFIFEESSIFHNISLIHQYPLWNIHMAIHYDIIFHIAWIYPSIISIHIPLIAHFISQFYIHSYPIMGLWNIHLSIVEWSRFHSIPFIYINIYISISIFWNTYQYPIISFMYIHIYIYQLYPLSIIHYDVISFIDAAAMPLLRISGVATCPFHRAAVQCAERVQKLQATSTDVVDNGG